MSQTSQTTSSINIKKIKRFLSNPKICFYTLCWLIVLLVVGTVVQKDIGIYRAQNIYFSSWLIWGVLPGGRLVLVIMFINLLSKLLFASPLRVRTAGVMVTHLGVMCLLIGGFLTAVGSIEGSMQLFEGDESEVYYDLHKLELAVINTSATDHDDVVAFSQDYFEKNSVLADASIKPQIKLLTFYKNCQISKRVSGNEGDAPLRGLAIDYQLNKIALDSTDQANLSAVELEISGLSPEQNGIYITYDYYLYGDERDDAIKLNVKGESYRIEIRHKQYQLPFSVELIDVEAKMYVGTSMASSYQSEIYVKEGDGKRRELISMNEPMRTHGYTFYQSTFANSGEIERTGFSVVKNYGRLGPYISSVVICIGIFLHMLVQFPTIFKCSSKKALIFLILNCCFVSGLVAQDSYDSQNVQSEGVKTIDLTGLPAFTVQQHGRLKPFDTFAENTLLGIRERRKHNGQSASAWLLDLLLKPVETSFAQPVFNIRNPDIVDALSLEAYRKGHLYSFFEVYNGLGGIKDQITIIGNKLMPESPTHGPLTLIEEQLWALFTNSNHYLKLSLTFSCFIPDIQIKNSELADELGLTVNEPVSFYQVVSRLRGVEDIIIAIVKKDPATFNDAEKEIARLSQLLSNQLKIREQTSDVLFIIPPGKDATKPEWLSPWQLLNGQPLTEKNRAYLDTLQQLVSAIYVGDSVAAKIAIDTFKAQVGVTRAMALEVRFNRANWFNYSMFLYLLACFSVLLGFQFKHKAFWICSFLFLIVGCGMHSTGIIQRMIIMQRPPVTTLYESILFVGWAVVILATFVEFFMRNGVALFVASIAGASLNMLSKQYAVDGDTMGMLVAVLNSNFWLGTHVVSITFGYGCTLLVGIFAHAYLFLRVFKPSDKLLLNNTYKNTVGLTFIALFFTTLGTILGGIWGDQSWGRFWGWDPKENGAMLIVLWLLMLVHGRVSGILREVGYCAGMIVANVVVMVAWFGVNLLGVGLHSYGFDKGAATNLFIFAAVEVAIAVGLGVVCKLRPLPK